MAGGNLKQKKNGRGNLAQTSPPYTVALTHLKHDYMMNYMPSSLAQLVRRCSLTAEVWVRIQAETNK